MNSNTIQRQTTTTGNSTPPSDPSFACIRCWKLKKKCDKNSPQCNRCASAGISCVYSDQPPTGRRVVTRPGAAARFSMVNTSVVTPPLASTKLNSTLPRFSLGPNNGPPSPDSDSATDFPFSNTRAVSRLPAPIYTPFHAIRHEIGDVFKIYLDTLNTWIPIVTKSQYTRLSYQDGSTPDAETCTLLLAIYLVTKQPNNSTGLDVLYTDLKRYHSNLYMISTQSIPIIQAGMLLAIYEQGQALHQLSYLTIGACVRLGQAVGMHRMVEREIESGESEEALVKRHVWWCLVILERILSLSNLTEAPPCASYPPKLTHFLPSYWPFTSSDIAIPVGTTTNRYTQYPEITFPDTSPLGSSVQAIYLFCKVFTHISTPQSPDLRQAEADYLDAMLMEYMGRAMKGSANIDGDKWHHSCVPMYIVMCALQRLHIYTLSQTSWGADSAFASASHRSILALTMLARVGAESRGVANDMSESTNKIASQKPVENFLADYNMPPFILTAMRDVALMAVQMVSHGVGDARAWKQLIAFYEKSLETAGRKWRLGGEYLDVVRRERCL